MFPGSALRQYLQLNNAKGGVAICNSIAGEAADSTVVFADNAGSSSAASGDFFAARMMDEMAAMLRSQEETVQLGNGVLLVSDVAVNSTLLALAARDAGHLGLSHMLV